MDTSAHTMAWTLYLLAQHPGVERQLCAELEPLGLLATPQVGLRLPGAGLAQGSAEFPGGSRAG
jgi:cytochrome P450